MWNLAPPPGFQGLHPDKPVTVYIRHLPHWRQEGATYVVTFRLNDSLPQVKLDELKQVRRQWEQQHAVGRFCKPSGIGGRFAKSSANDQQLEELSHETMRRVDGWLDQGMGSCRLKEPAAANVVVEAMGHFDGERYELDAYVVMPNHVHAIVRPLLWQEEPLERILQSWKRQAAREINRLLGLEGH